MTPQLDNILEKARLYQLRGQLLELRGKSKKRKAPKRYTVYILPWVKYSQIRNLQVGLGVWSRREFLSKKIDKKPGSIQPPPPLSKLRLSIDLWYTK